jgi:hypothetical protein
MAALAQVKFSAGGIYVIITVQGKEVWRQSVPEYEDAVGFLQINGYENTVPGQRASTWMKRTY